VDEGRTPLNSVLISDAQINKLLEISDIDDLWVIGDFPACVGVESRTLVSCDSDL